ncbi:hypothetical protein PRZ48_014400 [Zasmidium cellare]|uniref:Uncharacterized protein n=1 Tax=Zasmidium cellare TaxID=395010 RepID=A0ABR0DY68_ZASCE|nr:hypothetical protein PRZ48_014400 [Zasmidium cellare]
MSAPGKDFSHFLRQQSTQQRIMRQREEMLRSEAHKIAQTKKTLLERLTPDRERLRNFMHRKKTEDSEPQTSTPEDDSTSDGSSATITSKHMGPSDTPSTISTITVTEEAIRQDEGSLKRKRSDDEEEVDELAERVKRVKMERQKSLWESFDDSQFNMNSGLLYNAKLWEWYCLETYKQDLYAQRKLASPRTRRRLRDELTTFLPDRVSEFGPEIVMVANEIVSGGVPPEWHVARHQADLFAEWERRMLNKRMEGFVKDVEYIPWLGIEDSVPKQKLAFGAVDMGNPIQGRSLTAKRLDGREMGPEVVPDVGEMSWREWRRLSRACNLLLEAVEGLPWGWEMEDREWQSFSRAKELFNDDLSNNAYEKEALRKWENP